MLDEMSIKSLIEYDPKSGKNFGFIDLGAHSTSGDYDTPAEDSLVCMLVGMKGSWKIPVGYFLTKSISAEVQSGIIKEVLHRTFEIGLKVRCLTMDGTSHNTRCHT